MPRLPRYEIIENGFPVHKMWRGHNKEWNLKTPNEKTRYLKILFEQHKPDKANPLVALTLMSNHTHEIFALTNCQEFSNQMRRHHSKYGRYFNKKHKRSGKIAEDRPTTCLLGDEARHMTAVFYVHANPLRAGIKKDAADYEWSTHRLYAFGDRPAWLGYFEFPEWYINLGSNAAIRQRRYRKLFAAYLKYGEERLKPFYARPFFGSAIWMHDRMQALKYRIRLKRAKGPP